LLFAVLGGEHDGQLGNFFGTNGDMVETISNMDIVKDIRGPIVDPNELSVRGCAGEPSQTI
jgi:hypothetical protein